MDLEIEENIRRYNIVKQTIFAAFKNIKLEEGIGFWEAGAIDDYWKPHDKEYQEEKARDERDDWTKVYTFLDGFEETYNHRFDQTRYCFMDAKGLRFYLPVMLLLSEDYSREAMFENWTEEKYPPYKELTNLLTDEQKQVIIASVEDDVDYERWVEFYENFKGHSCHDCGKIHNPESYTKEEAIAKVESKDNYKLLQKLKKYFNK